MGYRNRKGFTIVELMIAISVFATAMTLVLAGVIFISRQYQQTSNRVALEEASRNIHQQIIQSIQFSGTNILSEVTVGPYSAVCVGNYMYIFGANEPVNAQATYNSQADGLFIKENPGVSCDSALVNTTNARNLLPSGAKVTLFSVSPTGNISTVFAKSPSDLLNYPGSGIVTCNTTITGKEFCATVKFDSAAARRVGS
jgi:prepilin-type N-terminal cleavage/methylation domain-containing protein